MANPILKDPRVTEALRELFDAKYAEQVEIVVAASDQTALWQAQGTLRFLDTLRTELEIS